MYWTRLGICTVLADPWPAYLKSGSMSSGITFMPRARQPGMTISSMSRPRMDSSGARKSVIEVLR